MAVLTDNRDTICRTVGLRERQRMLRDSSILEAAFALIAEKGYDAMTMDELAERAAISKPTLYHHFPSKEAIAVRALVELNESAVAAIRALDVDRPPVERLETVLRWMVRSRFSPAKVAFMRARPSMTPARAHPDYLRAAERRNDALADIIAAAQAAGDIDGAIPPRLIAHMVFNMICAPEYDELVARGDSTPDDIEEAVLTLIFHGAKAYK